VILALTLASSAVVVLQPWPLKILVDYALQGVPLPTWLSDLLADLNLDSSPAVLVILAAVASLGLFALNSLLDVGLSWSWSVAGQRMVYDLAAGLFHRLQRLSLAFHSRRSVGDSLSRLTEDTYSVYTLTSSLLVTPLQYVLTLVMIGAVAWRMDSTMTLVVAAVAPLMAGAATYFGPRIKRRARRTREARTGLFSFVHQTLTAIPMVQAFGAEGRNQTHFNGLAQGVTTATQQDALVNQAYTFATGVTSTVSSAIVLFIGGQQVLAGALSVGSLLVFLAYARSMQGAFSGLFRVYGSLRAAEASVDRVIEILDVEESVRQAADARPLPSAAGSGRHVRLEHVTFGYEPDVPVLIDVTLEARPGETVALVGATGAGKSTLASLIPRFYDPWEGRVLIDGQDIRCLELASVRGQVGFVLQDPFLLPLTVAENIAYGRPDASPAEIVAAAEAARADTFIRRLPQGYDTVVGERGATLSGGEKQRLAIARALLKDAPILILDEPTSALDVETEAQLLAALERVRAGRTAFVIAHRLSTIRNADRIVVMDQGRVVEQGSHAELLAAGGAYSRLYAHQAPVAESEAVP
jgi:ATP-binding cassette subfamily B protein/subfamily B ATP-binding cassette protein MsbA